jgi:galactokinase
MTAAAGDAARWAAAGGNAAYAAAGGDAGWAAAWDAADGAAPRAAAGDAAAWAAADGAAGQSAADHLAADRAAAWFRDCFGADPDCVWLAPGRANLIGEHTDYNEGLVLPFALGRSTLAAASRRADGALELRSRQVPTQGARVRVAELAPGGLTGWAAYPAGVAWALREVGYPLGGTSIAIDSDVPQGAGLSSSAALECAVAMALAQLYRVDMARQQVAALARRAENDFVGVPSGIMDQSASLLCEAGRALLLDCRSLAAELVPLDVAAAGLSLLLADTRVRHAHAGGEYAARRRECAEAARALGVRSLRDITNDIGAVDKLADPVLRRRAKHVITENWRVSAVARLLRQGDLAGVGPLLNESHASLRDDFEVSWPQADVAVDGAVAAGALGARMMGGGFGGSVIALLPEEHAVGIRAAMGEAFSARGWQPPAFLDATPAAGAHPVFP